MRRLRPAMALAMLLLAACSEQPEATEPPEATVVIDSGSDQVEVAVEVADTNAERARGLMGREELDEDAGMVFLVPEPTPTSFWMKGTLIPLSVAFWDQTGRIFRIHDMEPCREDPCRLYEPGAAWTGALEVNQGFFQEHGVEVGDHIRLEQ